MPACRSAASNIDLVPEPRSRSTQAVASKSFGVIFVRLTHGCFVPTTTIMESAVDFSDREQWVVDVAFDKPDIGASLKNRTRGLLGIGDSEMQINAGVGGVKGLDTARQPVVPDRLACSDGQRAAFQTGEIIEDLGGGFGARQHGTGLDQEIAASLRQHNAPADAVEQLDAVTGFERRDGRARRRLRQVQFVRRPRDMLFFRDGHEDAKLFQCHERLSNEFDECQAEERNKEEGQRAKQCGPNASGRQLADVGLQSHGRQGNGEQEGRNGHDPYFIRMGKGDQAVE